MNDEFRIEYIDLKQQIPVDEIRAFLSRFELSYDGDVEFTVAVRDQYHKLVGTGSFRGEVLRNIAVDESLQGAGLTSMILTALMQEMGRRGVMHYFVFTRPDKALYFSNLGFNEIARAEPYAALLESGLGSVESYCTFVSKVTAHLPAKRAAIVMNCNPFTKGHRALIARAAAENGGVIVFVVSEDCSLFPFEDRIRLVRSGVSNFKNVAVVPAGKYIVSSATFPAYFTRKENLPDAQTRLDIDLFAAQIAPRLDIQVRYVGEEPYCPVTEAYNRAMQDILPGYGIELKIMPRIEVDGAIVSASKVRDLIRLGKWDCLKTVLPDVTIHYLLAEENRAVLERVRASDCRH